jgi:uncharacterized membrane protein
MMDNWDSPWHGGTSWEAWLLFVLTVVIVIAVVAAVIYLVRAASEKSTAGTGRGASPESPRDILQRRYPAGEIHRDESQQKLQDL